MATLEERYQEIMKGPFVKYADLDAEEADELHQEMLEAAERARAEAIKIGGVRNPESEVHFLEALRCLE